MAFYHDQKKEKREKESKEVKSKAQIPLSPVKCRIVEM